MTKQKKKRNKPLRQRGVDSMATIHNAIMMNDRMSPVFNKMAQAMMSTLNVMGQVNQKAKKGITEQAFKQAESDIKKANNEILKMNNNLRMSKQQADQTAKSFGGMKNQLMNVYAGVQLGKQAFQAMQSGTDYLDNIASRKARVSLVNDGSQTDTELQDKMAAAAMRSRANYDAFSSSAIKMNMLAGNAFSGNDEALSFMETLNKMFVVSGASADESTNAMYQLNQAMASGRLQGDEFRSIIENAPMLALAIEKSTGKSRAELKQMSSDGELTAELIKNAMFASADEINEQFATMPMTFGQAMNNLGTVASRKFQGVSDAFSEAMSGDGMQGLFNGLIMGITVAASLATGAINVLSSAFGFLANNMGWIGPILAGLTIAFALYTAALVANKAVTFTLAAIKAIAAAKETIWMASVWLATGATFAQTTAQWGLNAALLACPLTWIVLAIIALIAVIYIVVGAINHFADTSVSATGIVAGTFFALGAFIYNIVAFIWNWFASLAEFFVNVWKHPDYAVRALFVGIGIAILDFCIAATEGFDEVATNLANAFVDGANLAVKGINWIIDALNLIPGVDIDNIGELGKVDSITSALRSTKDDLNAMLGEQPDDYWKAPKMDSISIGGAWDNGYNFGQGIDNQVGDFFGGINSDVFGGGDTKQEMFSANPDGGSLDKVGKIDEDITIAEEDIKLLKDIASTKFINKYSTLQPNMTVTFGDVYESSDIDKNKVMQIVDEMVTEAYAVAVVQEV